MVTAVPSRFAVLSIEDDDYKPRKVQKAASSKTIPKTKEDKSKQVRKDDKKKLNKNKKKGGYADGQQWEQWKQKDSMAVDETYEQDLQEAILLSKLSYLESQTENDKPKSENKQESTKKGNSKKSKKSTMTLEEFNNMDSIETQNIVSKVEKKRNNKDEDTSFFDIVEKETNQELIKEKGKAALKARLNQLDDNIMSAQLRAEVENRDHTIIELKCQVKALKEELVNVKSRNKKLYQILQHGEMKDKAAILAEVAKLQEIRDELTSEVSMLHMQLEQERSKTRTSTTEMKTSKLNNKRRLASENA